MNTKNLKKWFSTKKRDLPWRQSPTPYAVWISEVMLQQTQVAVVIPYFLRWMKRFPSIEMLAQASLDEVIKMWEGLGYYSRARYLHEGAKYILMHFQGELPKEEEHLKKIKGLGPYTRGAILSFAFHQKKAAVDGNVLRVLSRYFQIEEDITKSATLKRLHELAEAILPSEEPWVVSEALIELGATVCQKRARCQECPLQKGCQAYKNGVVERLPIKTGGMPTEYLYRAVAIIVCDDHYLIKRGKKGEVMSDLHEFPFFEIGEKGNNRLLDRFLEDKISEHFELSVEKIKELSEVSHSFTRYQVRLYPILFYCLKQKPVKGLHWVAAEELKGLAFSSGHRRICVNLGLASG